MTPTPSTCERCGHPFGCGAVDASCWCAEVELTDEVRFQLAATYQGCLCPSCSRELAAQPPPSPAHAPSRRA
jgi:hypothetical protein